MEVIIFFITLLIKSVHVLILSSIYSFILIRILLIIKGIKSTEFLKKVKAQKKYYRYRFGTLIFVGLFIYSYSYWGNSDHATKIPIGYWYKVEYELIFDNLGNVVHTTTPSIELKKSTRERNYINTSRFKVKDEKLSGKLASEYPTGEKYFVLNLKTDIVTFFKSKLKFNEYAEHNKLPKTDELLGFDENYRNHWPRFNYFLPYE